MIQTYKIKHNRNFSVQLVKAVQIAKFALKHQRGKMLTTTAVKHLGLPSAISNQILRKYQKSKTIKQVRSVKLTLPNQSIKTNKANKTICISCLKLTIPYYFDNQFIKVNQIEIDNTYCYVSVTYQEPPLLDTTDYIGVDLNTTGHCAVIGNPQTGKVLKLGKSAKHVHIKYKNTRRRHQRAGEYRTVKKIKDRENRIVRNLNHQVSRKIIDEAVKQNCHIKMEDLTGIRKNRKQRKSFRYALNSWSFYQLREFIEYKAKKSGIDIVLINPAYTSQTCSFCGSLGNRNGKSFKCPQCGHFDHADANASFNIGKWAQRLGRLHTDSDVCKGSTDAPRTLLT